MKKFIYWVVVVLILLENVQKSLELSNLLQNLGMNKFTLDDDQKEKKNIGYSKRMNKLVSTNVVGRRTDIITSKKL